MYRITQFEGGEADRCALYCTAHLFTIHSNEVNPATPPSHHAIHEALVFFAILPRRRRNICGCTVLNIYAQYRAQGRDSQLQKAAMHTQSGRQRQTHAGMQTQTRLLIGNIRLETWLFIPDT